MTADRKPLLTDEEIDELESSSIPVWVDTCSFGAKYARSIYEADRAKLLDRIAELEAMVPKWVKPSSEQCRLLCIEGWVFVPALCKRGSWLIVPPIPPPKEGE